MKTMYEEENNRLKEEKSIFDMGGKNQDKSEKTMSPSDALVAIKKYEKGLKSEGSDKANELSQKIHDEYFAKGRLLKFLQSEEFSEDKKENIYRDLSKAFAYGRLRSSANWDWFGRKSKTFIDLFNDFKAFLSADKMPPPENIKDLIDRANGYITYMKGKYDFGNINNPEGLDLNGNGREKADNRHYHQMCFAHYLSVGLNEIYYEVQREKDKSRREDLKKLYKKFNIGESQQYALKHAENTYSPAYTPGQFYETDKYTYKNLDSEDARIKALIKQIQSTFDLITFDKKSNIERGADPQFKAIPDGRANTTYPNDFMNIFSEVAEGATERRKKMRFIQGSSVNEEKVNEIMNKPILDSTENKTFRELARSIAREEKGAEELINYMENLFVSDDVKFVNVNKAIKDYNDFFKDFPSYKINENIFSDALGIFVRKFRSLRDKGKWNHMDFQGTSYKGPQGEEISSISDYVGAKVMTQVAKFHNDFRFELLDDKARRKANKEENYSELENFYWEYLEVAKPMYDIFHIFETFFSMLPAFFSVDPS